MSYEDGWLPGWEHHPRAAPKDGQYYDPGYPARVSWHTMEGWLSVGTTLGHPAPPQLWASPRTRLKVQSIPLIWGGFATYYQRGYPYDPDTVTNHVQIELEGFAGQTHTWSAEWLDWVADEVLVPIMRFYRHHGIPFDPVAGTPHMPGEAMGGSAADDAPQRFGWQQWAGHNAQGGHRHVPGNGDRWDPGPLDALHIGRRALAVIGGAPPAPSVPSKPTRRMRDVEAQLRTNPDGTRETFPYDFGDGAQRECVAWDFPILPVGATVHVHRANSGPASDGIPVQLTWDGGRGPLMWTWMGTSAPLGPVTKGGFHGVVVPSHAHVHAPVAMW